MQATEKTKAPVAGILTIVLICLIEWSIAPRLVRYLGTEQIPRFHPPSRIPMVEDSVMQWQISPLLEPNETQQKKERYDILLLGDSTCNSGLIPEQLKASTGMSTLNLGTMGYLYTEGYAEFTSLFIQRYGPPKILIYHVSPWPLVQSPEKIRQVGTLARYYQWRKEVESFHNQRSDLPKLDVEKTLSKAEKSQDESIVEDRSLFLTADRLLPTYHLRTLFREKLLALASNDDPLGQPRGNYPSDYALRALLRKTHGYLEEVDKIKDWTTPDEFKESLHKGAILGLHRLFSIAKKEGFPVLIFMAPRPEIARNSVTMAHYEQLKKDLYEVTEIYSHVKIAEPFLRFYPNDLFGTRAHVNKQGAIANTTDVGQFVRKYQTENLQSMSIVR